jgi:hypothetical protein
MPHEDTLTCGILVRIAIGLCTRQLLDVLFVVVADVISKPALLAILRPFPLRAPGVPRVIRAFVPGLENFLRAVALLGDDKAGVREGAIEAVVVGSWGPGGVEGHGEGDDGGGLLVVEEPLHGHVHPVEGSVSVEKEDGLVVLEEIYYCAGLDPGVVAIVELCGLHEIVVVPVGHFQ